MREAKPLVFLAVARQSILAQVENSDSMYNVGEKFLEDVLGRSSFFM
jgi:hypothetical protein